MNTEHEPSARTQDAEQLCEPDGAIPQQHVVDGDCHIDADVRASGRFGGAVANLDAAVTDKRSAPRRGHISHRGWGVHSDHMTVGCDGGCGRLEASTWAVPHDQYVCTIVQFSVFDHSPLLFGV